jgi:endonuclease/exonuclease/phosphatase (EEP) superfamily protein YafD
MLIKTLIYILGSICTVSSLLSLIKSEVWWIRIFDFPRVQILVLGILAAGLYTVTTDYSTFDYYFLPVLAAANVFQMARILPYTRFYKVQAKKTDKRVEQNEIGVYITNVFMDNREAKRCLVAIETEDPDIILAVETDDWWQRELKPLEKKYPYTIHVPLSNTYGMLFYSRFPISDYEVNFFIEKDIPSIKTKIELPSGENIQFYGLHPKPPAPAESKTSIPRDAELVVVGKDAKKQKLPVIVAGDLNDVAWSHTTHLFQRISGLLDPRRGRGMYSTFNSKYPLMRWPLDHLFHSNHFQIVELKRVAHIGSDHFPIYVKLCLVPEEKSEQEKPEASQGDHEEAAEKVEKAM